ncbi:DMT family transporter [Arthrobacter sp. 18067]|uniref:DMT family transporter n=1 Tax=Arthrobacter sp. 18067 TaxID=2681413 RepID=UPI001356CAFD|nr:EamA family transporter [Arthrobacter sp. 18067]
MKANNSTRWAAPAVITTATLWGTTGVASVLIPQVNPIAVGAASVGIGGLILGLISLKAVLKSFKTPGATRYIVLGALGLMLYMPLFYVSVSLTGAALGTIISIGSGPLFAGILEWIVDGKRVTAVWTVAMLVTVAGAGLLLAAREDHGSGDAAGLIPGVVAGLVAGVTYALYAFATGRLIQPCGTRPDGMAHRTVVAAIQGTAALPMLGLLALTGEGASGAPVWSILLYLAVIPTALGHTLFAFGLGRMKASTATLYTVLEPVVATILAVLILRETFRPEGWIGFPLVIAGLVLVNVRPKRRQKTEARQEAIPLEPATTGPVR